MMADQEQLAILQQGVDVWNAWRTEHPNIELDLWGADLHGAILHGAKLQGPYLRGAILTQAKLRGTDLTQAKLQGADLQGADLHGAILHGTDLTEANLTEANLTQANLTQANLTQANLTQANLLRANLLRASLFEAQLQEAQLQWANLSGTKLYRAKLRGTDLTQAILHRTDLTEADLTEAKLRGTDLTQAKLHGADLQGADLHGAILHGTDLTEANLTEANLTQANLTQANFHRTDLTKADLTSAVLQQVGLVQTKLDQAILTGCQVYGLSVWDIEGAPQDQSSLIITPLGAATVTVDDLEVAQFIYLLLKREKLRNVINTITSKAVLILGRFTPERKVVLDAMAEELRKHNLLPIIFDFEGATTRDLTETIKTLAGLSLFVIADITNPKSAPLELQATVPDYKIPFVPIIQEGEQPFAMFHDLSIYPWMLTPIMEYPSVEKLLQGFKHGIIDRAWAKHQEIMEHKGKEAKRLSIEDFIQNLEDQA